MNKNEREFTWESTKLAVPENILILLLLFLFTTFSNLLVCKYLGSNWSLRTGIQGFPFTGSVRSHLYQTKMQQSEQIIKQKNTRIRTKIKKRHSPNRELNSKQERKSEPDGMLQSAGKHKRTHLANKPKRQRERERELRRRWGRKNVRRRRLDWEKLSARERKKRRRKRLAVARVETPWKNGWRGSIVLYV